MTHNVLGIAPHHRVVSRAEDAGHRRDGHRGKHTQDGNNREQLNEGKTPGVCWK